MSSNPLRAAVEPMHRKTAQDWADRGNRLAAGLEPTTKGEFLSPRSDIRWVVRDGKCAIEHA